MTIQKTSKIGLLCILFSLCITAGAKESEQKELDLACEKARDIALKPLRKDIYQECLQQGGKSKSTCESDAKAYNGNRINGAPRFYELPACIKAFENRKLNK